MSLYGGGKFIRWCIPAHKGGGNPGGQLVHDPNSDMSRGTSRVLQGGLSQMDKGSSGQTPTCKLEVMTQQTGSELKHTRSKLPAYHGNAFREILPPCCGKFPYSVPICMFLWICHSTTQSGIVWAAGLMTLITPFFIYIHSITSW